MKQVYWVTRDVCGKMVFVVPVFEEFSVVSGSAITWENSESEFISFSPSRNVYAFKRKARNSNSYTKLSEKSDTECYLTL